MPTQEAAGEPVAIEPDLPFVGPEPDFEEVERETTQPLSRYRVGPTHVQPIRQDAIAESARYEQPIEDAAASESEPAPSSEQLAPVAGKARGPLYVDNTSTPFEPWPDPLETTRPPARETPSADEAPSLAVAEDVEHGSQPPPAPIEYPLDEPAGHQSMPDEPYASETAEPWPDPSATTQPPAHELTQSPVVATDKWEAALAASLAEELYSPPPAAAADVAFEPLPFAVPRPPEEPARDREHAPAPAPAPTVPTTNAASVSARAETRDDAEPVAPLPSPRLQHDVAAAWSPSPSPRHEPSFYPQAAQPVALPAVTPLPARRDWRDLVRRAANVAFLTFCGWFIAVLLLIAVFRFVNPPFSMLMAMQWMSGTSVDKQWVPIERISPNLTRAVIVAEDGRFCEHWGVDFIEAAQAIRRATDGYPRGASTITMQVAKNLFLLPAKSYLRKMIEIPLTFAIELAWPKWRILEVYLNIVEWGPGVFGAEAASRAHFGRSAAGLSARQAAQLAVVLPNPIVRDAGSPGPRTAHRASVIQARAARTRAASSCVDGRR